MKIPVSASVAAILVAFALTGAAQAQSGAAPPQHPPNGVVAPKHPDAAGKPEIYLFKGLLPLPHDGIDQLAAKLQARGYAPRVYSWSDADGVAGEIEAAHGAGKHRGAIFLIGHSLGGKAAVSIASRLQAARIPVSLIVTFDPYNPDPVPGNVRGALNFYQSNNGIGNPLSPAAGFHGRLVNNDLKSRTDLAHRTIPADPGVQSRVIAQIAGAGQPPASAASAAAASPRAAAPAPAPPM
jgi:pimeloyl-ACP methyl ester carboxylesterase